MKKTGQKLKIMLIALSVLLIAGIMLVCLLYNGIIWFNNPSPKQYPLRGVDVSAYQGKIDWTVLSQQNIDFAFIKATEGSSFQDQAFQENWYGARETPLKVGAYHFFSYDSSGLTQAENFIKTVPVEQNSLPPVIDLEFYGDKKQNPPDQADTQQILNELITQLEQHYGKKPIIYVTQQSYDLYISGDYLGYPIWIRDILKKPILSDQRAWTFWQYSNRATVPGYQGTEKYIDFNVFNGTKQQFTTLFGS